MAEGEDEAQVAYSRKSPRVAPHAQSCRWAAENGLMAQSYYNLWRGDYKRIRNYSGPDYFRAQSAWRTVPPCL